jgi:HD-GYP domain-containing protein (c-di-GMP phosphodiesterase class II)
MQRHPQLGAALARRAGFSASVEEIVLTHQERWDGAGYPSGMGGLDIPLSSRLLAVADTYDCLTSSRPYRPARRPLAALAELRRSAGTQLQPEVVACFVELPCCNGRRRQRALTQA